MAKRKGGGKKGKARKGGARARSSGGRKCVTTTICPGKGRRKLCYGITKHGNYGIVSNTPG